VILRATTCSVLLAAAFGSCGCTTNKHQVAATAPAVDPRQQDIDERKEQVMQQLAVCESGSWGPQSQPIYGGRGAYHGRFQFTARTYITYQQRHDGTVLTTREAIDAAQDYDKAMKLASFMIFELGEAWHWPLCSRKLGIPAKVQEINSL
jgi:hypothetical protein